MMGKKTKNMSPIKTKNFGKTFKRLLAIILGKYKLQSTIAIFCIVFSSLASVVGAYMLAPIIDNKIAPLIGVANADFLPLVKSLAVLGAIYLVGVVSLYVLNTVMMNISEGSMKDIRDKLFEKMQNLPISFYDGETHGNLMSRFTNDIDTLRQLVSQSLPQLVSSILTVVGVFVAMLLCSPFLTLIIVIVVAFIFIIVKNLGSKSSKYYVQQQKDIGALNGYIEEMIEGQRVVKVFNHEEKAKEDFDVLNKRLCESGTKANGIVNIIMPILGNLGYVACVLIAVFGSLMLINGFTALTIGGLISFLQLSRRFINPISQISQQLNFIIMGTAGAERVFEIMDRTDEVDDGTVVCVKCEQIEDGQLVEKTNGNKYAWKVIDQGGEVHLVEVKGDVRFKDVDFGYVKDKMILKNLSLYAKPNQKIAFVGSTGAGKTTIANLVNRFYEINDGQITFDGIDVKTIKKADLRGVVAVVLQDTHLFTGTIMENIRYGRLDATDKDVIKASEMANADTFVKHLPNGYKTEISADGANLSQGQRQLIAIARAMVANTPVVILDEATSSVDTRTEKLIEESMDKLMENKTVFVIAHRLSTVRNSNAIMVLENGEIVERGDHDELLKQKGKYYKLCTGKFELD